MSAVRPLKAGSPPAQIDAADVVTVNTVDRISAGTLAIGPTTATEVDIANASATVKIKGNVDQSILTNTNNSVDLGSQTHGWRDLFLYDGVDGRKLSDTTLSSSGAELIGINAAEFATLAPAANNVLSVLKAIDNIIDPIADARVTKTFVRLASINNISDLTTLANGGTLDGKTLATGDRIFLGYQTTTSEDGIYVVNATGAPTRATDFDAPGDVADGCLIPVTTGDVNGGTVFVVKCSAGTITPIVITHLRVHSAGTGIVITPAGQISADISASLPQPVSTGAGVAGSSGKLSDAAHVHGLSAATTIAALAGTATDVSFNNGGKLTDVLAGTNPNDVVTKTQLDTKADASSLSTEITNRTNADTAIAFPPPVTQSTSTLTLDDTHNGKTIYVTYAGTCTITVPQTLTAGFSCSVQNVDAAATTTWVASGTQNLWGAAGFTHNTIQYATSGVIVRSATHAALVGALDS